MIPMKVRSTYDFREYVTVTAQKSHDLPTTPVQSLHDLRTASVRLCLWPFYDAQYMKSHDDRK